MDKSPIQMTDEELSSELEKLHGILHAGQDVRLRNEDAPVKEHWDTWDKMFCLFKEQWTRKMKRTKVNP